uniref:IRG-type G domain-containing protein n=1 Tax=Acrobeloides nanus TaxID=290746 RepID=A0A914C2X1_9BILA
MQRQEISAQTALKSLNRPSITHELNSSTTPTAVPSASPFVPKLASVDTVNYNDILKKREQLQEKRLKFEEKAAEERLKKLNEKTSIGFFGLRDSGKSRLIAALTGVDKAYLSKFSCIFVLRFLDASNFVDMSGNARFYEINHPNGGFLGGSISGNRDIYQNFFEKSHLPNLSCLFITTNGQIREEDIFVAQLANQHNIPCAFLRTRSDEWLDSFCEKRTPSETIKNAFKEKDLKFVHDILFSVDTSLLNIPVFIISSLVFKNPTKMKNYMIDEGDFLKYLEKYNVCLSLEQGLTQPLASLKTQNVVNNSEPSPNIAFIGRITSGKSSLIDALRGITSSHPESATHKQSSERIIDGKTVVEITYSDLGPKSNFADDIVRKYNLTIKTTIYLVIGNAVGERDLWLARYFTQDGYPLFILLTQSDKHIDSLSNGENFTEETRNDYKINRKYM